MTRPFRFGLLIDKQDLTAQRIAELARRAEGDGYQIVLTTDHLGTLGSLPVLQAAADASSLRVGTLVLNNDMRQPVVLAHDLAALDSLTDGRLEIGLGAGWEPADYAGAGISFESPAKRVARLQASLSIIRQALSEGRIDRVADDAYPTLSVANMPRSVQRPHPPFLIGGGGRRVLSFAAREAQIVGLDPRALPAGGHDGRDVTAALFDEKIGWIRAAAGNRLADIDLNVVLFGVDPAARGGSSPTRLNPELTADEIAQSPHYLLGDLEQMTDQLIARRERWGINYLAVRSGLMGELAPVIGRLAGR